MRRFFCRWSISKKQSNENPGLKRGGIFDMRAIGRRASVTTVTAEGHRETPNEPQELVACHEPQPRQIWSTGGAPSSGHSRKQTIAYRNLSKLIEEEAVSAPSIKESTAFLAVDSSTRLSRSAPGSLQIEEDAHRPNQGFKLARKITASENEIEADGETIDPALETCYRNSTNNVLGSDDTLFTPSAENSLLSTNHPRSDRVTGPRLQNTEDDAEEEFDQPKLTSRYIQQCESSLLRTLLHFTECRHVDQSMQRLQGDLSNWAAVNSRIDLKEWMSRRNHYLADKNAALNQVLCIIQELHSVDVVVGDLNPGIIKMCPETFSWKLASLHGAACLKAGVLTKNCDPYEAPEIVKARTTGELTEIGTSADMWSLGLIILEMMTGKPPNGTHRYLDNMQQYVNRQARSLTEDDVDQEALVELLSGLLRKDPKERFTIEEVFRTRYARRNYRCCPIEQTSKRTSAKPEENALVSLGAAMARFMTVRLALRRCRRKPGRSNDLLDTTQKTCSIDESAMPSESVYVRRLGERTYLEIDLETVLPLKLKKLANVRMLVDEMEEPVELRVRTVQKGEGSLKSFARLDTAGLKTSGLSKRSKTWGSNKRKYAKLRVSFTVVTTPESGSFSFGGRLYVKVISHKALLFLDKLPSWYQRSIDAMPHWMRFIGSTGSTCVGSVP